MRRLIVLLVVIVIGGCASAPQVPLELQYAPPVGESGALATIQGSQEDSILLDDYTSFVIAVDGKRVMSERNGWSSALRIAAGNRNITVAFKRGVFNAQADVPLSAAGGRQYQVRFTSDVQVYGPSTYCDFWIVDMATQKPVTEIRRGLIGGGGQRMVPIFIPAK